MFKLIALRPLKGCRESALKCLKIGQMYYFCNDYIITEDGIRMRDEYVKPLPEDFFTTTESKGLRVNISAVVGMNGDGKSTLIELAMRLINNCAKHYRLTDKDRLLRIENIKAELYYQIDNEVYVIREAEDEDYTSLMKYADLSNHDVKEWKKLMTKVQGVKRNDNLFYTIVSNYSHYAYNTGDFKDEWNENIKWDEDESEQCWLYNLFHKNDGYLAPMTIHPYRFKGNIDINRETDLTMQRLMALYIQEPNPKDNEESFRRIGEKDADILRLTDEGQSKLHERSIVKFFKDVKSVSALKTIISKIEDCIKKYDELVVEDLQDNKIEVVEQCLELIADDKDAAYQTYLNDMMAWVSKRRKLYSSKSDLRLFLSALLKFNHNVKDTQLPYMRLVKRFKKFDKLNVNQLKRLRMVYEVARLWDIPTEILTKDYSDLSDIERCQHYIIYKTIDICGTYPRYRDMMDEGDGGWNGRGLALQCGVIADAIGTLKQDDSHVTLKLRQCLNFIEKRKKEAKNIFEKLDKEPKPLKLRDANRGSLLVGFDNLKSHFKKDPFPLELLPPPIYKSEPLYKSKESEEWVPYRFLSSGEKQLLQNMGALLYHLRNLDSVADDKKRYENVNIFLEEIELYFHPDYQRRIVKMLLEKIYAINFQHIKRINIVFVTHSPFILSDIPLCNVLFLKGGKPYAEGMQENTFGANIHGMLRNGFFLPSLPMGEFAHEKINRLFEMLNGYKLDSRNREQAEWFYSSIMRVGEPYLREQLMRLYNMHYPANYD